MSTLDRAHPSYQDFAREVAPSYPGPYVRIQVESSSHVYQVSKKILCQASRYFEGMFERGFIEAQRQAAYLHEMEGVVSVRSFEMLLQWMHTREVNLDGTESAQEQLSAWIEFIRIADMCCVDLPPWLVTSSVQNILITNPAPLDPRYQLGRHPDNNTHCLMREHIESASKLPNKHPLRVLLARASVEGYLRLPDYKFVEATQAIPRFGSDLFREVRAVVHEIRSIGDDICFTDPITGLSMRLNAN